MLPPWPATAGGVNPGRSAIATSADASPITSAAGRHPEPSTTAISWLSVLMAWRSAAAASRAATSAISAALGVVMAVQPRAVDKS